MAPPRQFARYPGSFCEVQNERVMVKSPFQPLNRRRFNRVSTTLGLVAGLQHSRIARIACLREPADRQLTRILGTSPAGAPVQAPSSRLLSPQACKSIHSSPTDVHALDRMSVPPPRWLPGCVAARATISRGSTIHHAVVLALSAVSRHHRSHGVGPDHRPVRARDARGRCIPVLDEGVGTPRTARCSSI